MKETLCPQCGRTLTVDAAAAFCPFCGGALTGDAPAQESAAVREALQAAERELDPQRKHALLTRAQAEHPESLAIAEELLHLGRLQERSARAVDFTVIKSYLLNLYLEPQSLTPEQYAAMHRELFDHPDLQRCLALSADRAAFLNRYLTRLSTQFVELFLRGSSHYMRRFFGFAMESRAPKLLASPAARMLAAMRDDPDLTAEQRSLLMHAFYTAFSTQMSGETQWLMEAMAQLGVVLA